MKQLNQILGQMKSTMSYLFVAEPQKSADYVMRVSKVCGFVQDYMHKNTKGAYHNFDAHTVDVVDSAMRIGELEKIALDDRFILVTAALLHDVVQFPQAKDNEERSVELASPVLRSYGYSFGEIQKVKDLIMATKMPTKPKTKLEMIICDADLDNLGREDFLEKGEALRIEYGLPKAKAWYERQLAFLKGHKYYTESANVLRAEGVQRNIALVEKVLEGYK
jgi:predicted metal-dependent HD superfamily phosphohydrolase